MTYYTNNGDIVTRKQIEAAVSAGTARLVHSHKDGGIATSLSLDGIDRDTRGECYSVWDEVWTQVPKSVAAACYNAK